MRNILFIHLFLFAFIALPYTAYGQDEAIQDEAYIKELEGLADNGDAEAQYKMGARYISGNGVKKDVKRAIDLFNKSAAQDYTRSLYILGKLYWDGIYIKKNDGKAIEWFEKAARKGHGKSQYNLAVIFSRYLNNKEFLIKSYAWFSVVAKRGHPRAGKMRDELAEKLESFDIVRGKRMAGSYYSKYVVAFDKKLKEDNSDNSDNSGDKKEE